MKHQNSNDFASGAAGGFNLLLDMQRKNLQALSAAQSLVFETMQNLTGCQLGLLSQMADRCCSFGQEPVNENPPEEKAAQPEAKEQRKKTA